MDFDFLLRGLIFGFSIAAPVGPIGVLCIQRTLDEGRAFGLVSGLGNNKVQAFRIAVGEQNFRHNTHRIWLDCYSPGLSYLERNYN